MESRLNIDSDRVEMLETQLREARDLAAESDRKFEEVMVLLKLYEEDYQDLKIRRTILEQKKNKNRPK